MTTSFEPAFAPGTMIRGKWNAGQYRIERLLGEGANGRVYLVRSGSRLLAMKIGHDALDHQSEANVLRELSKSSTSFKNYLVDVDDAVASGREYPFFVTQYVRGITLNEFIKQFGTDWIPVIGMRLLKKLTELHGNGYAFCDLKPENLLVSRYGEVHLIDFGGITAMGRSVKQFTEVFDRGFWQAGTRTADEAYDLFSFAALWIGVADKERRLHGFRAILPQNRTTDTLLDMLQSIPALAGIAPVLRKALLGGYSASAEALTDWSRLASPARHMPDKQPGAGWLAACFVASLALFAAVLWTAWPF
ncbi:protein kinase domain-containing protein [Paenibacillus ginsengihumi]|uniref:protein kinase domain-containing protein n=1 Tax=Paenibacillus ginsengihumi TaxID=431596 RepID=UPI00036E4CC2|nr:protein kinase [Paenibacillus ginsengihumi]